MNFLDNLVLPQSNEHIQLLHYILILIQFLFIPFISVLLIGSLLSVYYRSKGFNEGNSTYLKFARDIIEVVTINKSIGIILGIAPLLTILLVFTQLLHTTGAAAVMYLTISFLFSLVGIILIYTYRFSVLFSDIFEHLKDVSLEDKSYKNEISTYRNRTKHLSGRSGNWGVVLIAFSLYFYITAQTTVTYNLGAGDGAFFTLFSLITIIRFLEFLSGAIAISGAAIFFVYFYWDGGRKIDNADYSTLLRNIAIKFSFIGGLTLPLFLLIDVIAMPGNIVTGTIITYSLIGLIFLFIGYHFVYAMIKNNNYQYSGQLFFIFLFAMFAFIIKDQIAMSNATKPNSVILASQYDQYLFNLKGGDKVAAKVDGEQVYKNICSSCHSFDHKIVGPPYKETLPKYEGKINDLVAFIRNPVKKNPAYPPMPNPGIKPAEAQAVAEYILKTYKTK